MTCTGKDFRMFLVILGLSVAHMGCGPTNGGAPNPRGGDSNVPKPKPEPKPKAKPKPKDVPDANTRKALPKVTMAHIWSLREKGRHEELIKAVDVFLKSAPADGNRTGTCLFLKGDSYRQLSQFPEAGNLFANVVAKYPGAKWPDPKSGKDILVRPLCGLALTLVAEKDKCAFPETSAAYAKLAWKYLNVNKFETSRVFAAACVTQFQQEARKQQVAYSREYPSGQPTLKGGPEKNKVTLEKYWALYDVGTCAFCMGLSFEKEAGTLGNTPSDAMKAKRLYKFAIEWFDRVLDDYPGAQCWDPTGPWYWSVKKGATDHKKDVELNQPR